MYIENACPPCLHPIHSIHSTPEVFTKADQVLSIVGSDLLLREGWLSEVMDLMVRIRALQHFLKTGKLISATDPT